MCYEIGQLHVLPTGQRAGDRHVDMVRATDDGLAKPSGLRSFDQPLWRGRSRVGLEFGAGKTPAEIADATRLPFGAITAGLRIVRAA